MDLNVTCENVEIGSDGREINLDLTNVTKDNLNNTEVANCVDCDTFVKTKDHDDILNEMNVVQIPTLKFFRLDLHYQNHFV